MADEHPARAGAARSESLTPIQDAVKGGTGIDVLVAQERAEASARVSADTKLGEVTAGAAVRKWYSGAVEWFGTLSWRPGSKKTSR